MTVETAQSPRRRKPAAAKQQPGPVYKARRNVRISGIDYTMGDDIPAKVIESLPRPEALERAGLITREA